MNWPLGNCGATCLRDVTDTVQTVQYSDSMYSVQYVYIQLPPRQPPRKLLDLFLIRYLRRPSRLLSTLVLVFLTQDKFAGRKMPHINLALSRARHFICLSSGDSLGIGLNPGDHLNAQLCYPVLRSVALQAVPGCHECH